MVFDRCRELIDCVMIARDEITDLLRLEVDAIVEPAARQALQLLLIDPIPLRCTWDYGEWEPGREGVTFACWKLARDIRSGLAIVHCEDGFGPKCPYGLVWDQDQTPSTGPDSSWFRTFREAVADVLGMPPVLFNLE